MEMQPPRAVYRVILKQPITNDQAAMLRQTLAAFAPARCHLASWVSVCGHSL